MKLLVSESCGKVMLGSGISRRAVYGLGSCRNVVLHLGSLKKVVLGSES